MTKKDIILEWNINKNSYQTKSKASFIIDKIDELNKVGNDLKHYDPKDLKIHLIWSEWKCVKSYIPYLMPRLDYNDHLVFLKVLDMEDRINMIHIYGIVVELTPELLDKMHGESIQIVMGQGWMSSYPHSDISCVNTIICGSYNVDRIDETRLRYQIDDGDLWGGYSYDYKQGFGTGSGMDYIYWIQKLTPGLQYELKEKCI